MRLILNKDQTYIIHRALEVYEKSLQQQLKERPVGDAVTRLIDPDLFQLDLLINWFEKQRDKEL